MIKYLLFIFFSIFMVSCDLSEESFSEGAKEEIKKNKEESPIKENKTDVQNEMEISDIKVFLNNCYIGCKSYKEGIFEIQELIKVHKKLVFLNKNQGEYFYHICKKRCESIVTSVNNENEQDQNVDEIVKPKEKEKKSPSKNNGNIKSFEELELLEK